MATMNVCIILQRAVLEDVTYATEKQLVLKSLKSICVFSGAQHKNKSLQAGNKMSLLLVKMFLYLPLTNNKKSIISYFEKKVA